ncbi:MAG TPA: hypothetical protein VKA08_08950 [Balneolales bacterium]|nr:hypothetical protein [Balneolales bacterium]
MNSTARHDFKIIGENSTGGGYFNNARVIGNGIVKGDMDCVNFKSVGDSKVNGNLKAANLRVVGSISITGTSKSDTAVITGNLDASGDVQSHKIVLRGGITTGGNVKGDDVKLKGYVTIKKNCETEIFRADGQLTIEGLLNADEVTIRTYGRSRVAEIGGNKITIRKGSKSSVTQMVKFLFMPSNFDNGTLQADSIEGDEIRLAGTKAKVVRGKNIIINDGCELDLVEYKENLRIQGRSTIKEKRKIL